MADSTKKNQSYDEYYNYLKKGYSESEAVKKAQQALNSLKKPDAYQSQYSSSIKNYTDKYLNSRFDYNFNNDPSYQRYKQQYTENAQRAMKDTVGQVSALTGGFGNSYAQTAGQTAYNEYMDKLNNVIDSLEQKAYNRYLDKNNQIYNGIGLMQNIENTNYNRYRDAMNDYYVNRDYYTNQYNNERNFDYGKYNDMLGAYWNNANYQNTDYWNTVGQENADRDYALQQQQFAYQKQQDAIANRLAQQQLAYQKEQDEVANRLAQQKASSSASSRQGSLPEKAQKQSQLHANVGYADTYNKIKKGGLTKQAAIQQIMKFANTYQYAYDWNESYIYQLAKTAGLSANEIAQYFG